MLEKPAGYVIVDGVVGREFHGDGEHLGREVGHPGGGVGEVELVGGQIPIGMLIPLPQEAVELVLGEVGIDQGVGDHLKGRIPGGESRKLPRGILSGRKRW